MGQKPKPPGAFDAPLITAIAVGGERRCLYKKIETKQGWMDLNHRIRESKSRALPFGDNPVHPALFKCDLSTNFYVLYTFYKIFWIKAVSVNRWDKETPALFFISPWAMYAIFCLNAFFVPVYKFNHNHIPISKSKKRLQHTQQSSW